MEELLLHHRMGLGLVGRQPHRSAPHALGAERHRRRHLPAATDAAGAEHRDVADGVDDLGDQHHRADLAGVPAGLAALGDDHVDAGVDVALGVLGGARQRADRAAFLLDAFDHVRRRRAEGVDEQHRFARQRDLELRVGAAGREGCCLAAADQTATTGVGRQLGDAVAVEDVVDELTVAGGDHVLQRRHREPALVGAGVLGGHDQVDAVRAIADLGLDPVEVDLELAITVAGGAEHAHAACLRHGDDHVAAVGEGEDRQVDAEHVGDRGLHARILLAAGPLVAGPANAWAHSIHSRASGPRTARRVSSTWRRCVTTRQKSSAGPMTESSSIGVAPRPRVAGRRRELDPHVTRGRLESTVLVAPTTGDHAELGDVSQAVGRPAARRRPRRRRPGRGPTPPSGAPSGTSACSSTARTTRSGRPAPPRTRPRSSSSRPPRQAASNSSGAIAR